MERIFEALIIILVMIVVLSLFIIIVGILSKSKPIKNKKPRKLKMDEAELFADYFHNEETMPDIDGYVGKYNLPKEVMEIYIKKYSKERGWD